MHTTNHVTHTRWRRVKPDASSSSCFRGGRGEDFKEGGREWVGGGRERGCGGRRERVEKNGYRGRIGR